MATNGDLPTFKRALYVVARCLDETTAETESDAGDGLDYEARRSDPVLNRIG